MDFSGKVICTCGKDMSGNGGSYGGTLTYTVRECTCGIMAIFYAVEDGYEVGMTATKKETK